MELRSKFETTGPSLPDCFPGERSWNLAGIDTFLYLFCPPQVD